MSDYLSEPTLAAVFPSALEINGINLTLDGTDSLSKDGNLTFQWGLYIDENDPWEYWVIRFCKPNDPANPTAYLYDQIASSDADGLSTNAWAMACLIQSCNLWND